MVRKSAIDTPRGWNRGSPLDTLCNEILSLILANADDLADLRSLCLVSRRLYKLTVSILYRHITFHAIRGSAQELLKRLLHPQTRIPKYIQTFRLSDRPFIEERQEECYQHIHTLLLKVKNLRVFGWEAPENIPTEILDTIGARFPNAGIEIDWTYHENPGTVSLRPHTMLAHATRSQITRFDFTSTCRAAPGMNSFYQNFKEDLMNMIISNRCLLYLKITSRYCTTFAHPEYLGSLRSHELPQLERFILDLPRETFFTRNELDLWGAKGGWDRLTVLELKSMELFRTFIDRALNLRELKLIVDDFHVIVGTKGSFPLLLKFCFLNLTPLPLFPRGRHAVPLELLEQMPNLTYLDIYSKDSTYELCVDAPTIQEVKEIRRLCPRLEELGIHLNQLGPWASWPRPILDELARFQEPIQIKLKLHKLSTKRSALVKGQIDYYAISCHIRRERQRFGLPFLPPFGVTYNPEDDSRRYDDDFDDPTSGAVNYDTCLGAFTMTWHYSSTIDRLTTWKHHANSRIGRSRLGVWRRRRAERIAEELAGGSNDDSKDKLLSPAVLATFPTLYDTWTQ